MSNNKDLQKLNALAAAVEYAVPAAIKGNLEGRTYADLRWAIFDLTGEDRDYDLFIEACHAAVIDPDTWLERRAAA